MGGKTPPGLRPLPSRVENNPFPARRVPHPILSNGQPNLEDFVWLKLEAPTLQTRNGWQFHPAATKHRRSPQSQSMSYVLRWNNTTTGDFYGDTYNSWWLWHDFTEGIQRCIKTKKNRTEDLQDQDKIDRRLMCRMNEDTLIRDEVLVLKQDLVDLGWSMSDCSTTNALRERNSWPPRQSQYGQEQAMDSTSTRSSKTCRRCRKAPSGSSFTRANAADRKEQRSVAEESIRAMQAALRSLALQSGQTDCNGCINSTARCNLTANDGAIVWI